MLKTKFFTGCEPEPNDPRDLLGSNFIFQIPSEEIPDIDWREQKLVSPVKNQLNTNCCTGEAVNSAYESLKIIKKGEVLNTSELFTYYNARRLAGAEKYDGGAFIRDALKSLNQDGTCFEQYWPFSTSKIMDKPSWLAYFGARWNRINRYYKLSSIDEIRSCLYRKIPVVGGIFVYDSMEKARKTGYIPVPKPSETKRDGHCVQFAGANKKEIIIKNSWGDFGDEGYLYAPHDFIKKFSFDWWAIQ